MALFLASQLIRTPEFREQLKSITAQLDHWSKLHGHDLDPSYLTITEEQCREIQANSIVTIVPGLAETMGQMKWIRLRNQTSMPFWSSDHPINMYNPRPSEIRGNVGLKCRGIQVYFPLSPTLTLCLCDPIVYGALPNDGVVNDVHVMFQNSLQLRESTRCVLSRSGDFTLASEILNAQPEFGGPNRLRSRVAGDLP